jgi:hypothetical protein
MYYLSTQDKVCSAYEIRRKVGIDPSVNTNLDILNRAGVYPITNIYATPTFDTRLFNTTVSYVINGQYANKTFTASDKPLNEAKTAAYIGLKEKYEAQMVFTAGDWGIFTLIAIAAKTSSPKTDEETDVITDIKIMSDNLAADIDDVQAATSVAAIDSILNS